MKSKKRSKAVKEVPTHIEGPTPLAVPRRVALVARDWLATPTRGRGKFSYSWGFAPHFGDIARAADREGADLIVFSLWSHNADKLGNISRSQLFPTGTQHKAVFLEVKRAGVYKAEIYLRDARGPIQREQRVGKSTDPTWKKKRLMDELPSRQFGKSLLMLCGETNIIKTKRYSSAVVDKFGFRCQLQMMGIKLILNPIHDYMKRPEMNTKRKILSRKERVVLSVWNRGCKKGSEGKLPWAAFSDGKDLTEKIVEICQPVKSQPAVRLGIWDMKS